MNLPRVQNPIRLFAVICVAVTSGFVMYMSYQLLNVLRAGLVPPPRWR
jgi:hypothetical protein